MSKEFYPPKMIHEIPSTPQGKNEKIVSRSDTKTYSFTDDTFIKRELPPSQRKKNMKGEWITLPWMEERFRNEAVALALISKETTIPVPRVVAIGRDKDGLAFLETELLRGIPCDYVVDECRVQGPQRHNDAGPCNVCESVAMTNTDRYVREKVLPQLDKLRSTTTGLDGFVIPPPWILAHDRRLHWASRSSIVREFVFCHGDLTAHNIMVHPETLEVLGIYDWEHAGYFPEEFQQWRCSRAEYNTLFTNKDRIRRLVSQI
ncbi:hypothetical protein AOQ84DRAFT_349418 [Glonium stellatum]|uniref:Aminoglycoside phosphotransferase domain-containing protein n=1 Tax=Glonium stellatum TaxID=574774 RepID=A0A8E2JMK7_9PEZI|nr:hypothetical protein AOQ84DRAFT_349418 [Glonium stellatum]